MEAYQHLFELFRQHLQEYIHAADLRRPKELYEPEAYILRIGGKRIRPLLALVGCELMGANPDKALPASLSIELFHNFSLIHDDILDQAPLRRGNQTVHERFGQNVAILSGDVMLVKALAILENYPDPQYRQLSALLQKTAIEVCEGQQLDMNFEKRNDVTVSDYIHMISLKTAVLLGCSLQMGSICAGADTNTQQQLNGFGLHLGIAFQLLDDLLDCFPDNEKNFGKKVGGDITSDKKTFLLLKAYELGNDQQKARLAELSELKDLQHKIDRTLELFSQLKVDDLCRQEADRHTSLAIDLLQRVNCDKTRRTDLETFAHNLLLRKS